MRRVDNLLCLREGELASFVYYGGENPGTLRTVRVSRVGKDRIVGCDVAKDDTLRVYLYDKAADIKVLAEAREAEPTTRMRETRIGFDVARDSVHEDIDSLNAEDLAEVAAEMKGFMRGTFDINTHEVVLEEEVVIPHFDPIGRGFDIVNEDNERLPITFDMELLIDNKPVTPEEMVRQIAEHLGLTIE